MNDREMITDVSLYQTLESVLYVTITICKYVIYQGGTIYINFSRAIYKRYKWIRMQGINKIS